MTRIDRLAIAVLVVLAAAMYAAVGLLRHWHFGSSAFDLGIFDQVVWHLSRFERPSSSIRGVANIFGDHFHPILALFVPVFWLVPAAESLIVAQACLLALSVVPVFVYLRGRLPRGPSVVLATSYALFWALQRTAEFDVHELAFAPLLIATMILAIDRGRWRLFWGAGVLLALVKEDLLPVLACFGVYLMWRGERVRGAALALSGLAAFLVVLRVVIPFFGSGVGYGYVDTYAHLIREPWLAFRALVEPPIKLVTIVSWLAPFAFLSLGSPLVLLAVPLVLERFLSASPYHWGPSFHYSAPLAPILVMSAGDTLGRIARRIEAAARPSGRTVGALVGTCLVVSAFVPGHLPHWKLLSPAPYRFTSFERSGARAIAMIPPTASVVAQASVVPHLSHRDRIYMLDARAPDAEFVVAAADTSPWPAADPAAVLVWLAERRQRGYEVVFEENGWLVLRHPQALQPSFHGTAPTS
ncbi:MAG TPA: DUF2079 domain-containing protein [Vicinamibacterales bacterium]|jgi:uncharacterized membrane protein